MIRFYVTTKMGGKDINPIREVFTAQCSKEEVPALVNNFIEEFNKRVTPAYKRDLISIEYEGDTSLKLFSEIETDKVIEEQQASENKIVEENTTHQELTTHTDTTLHIDGHEFKIVKDWYVNNRGTKCRNYKCANCEVTGKEKEDDSGEVKFMYDDKYTAKKWHTCNH